MDDTGSGRTERTEDSPEPPPAPEAQDSPSFFGRLLGWSGNGDGAWIRFDLGSVRTVSHPIGRASASNLIVPWCTFTDPEVARVGLNEAEAAQKGIPYQVSRYDLANLDRAIADGELIADSDYLAR